MSATGLDVFDRTLQTTHAWLNEIGKSLGPDKQRAYHALRAVLHVLRDRLPIEIAMHLSAQLPTLVRGVFWEAYRPAGKPEKIRTSAEFLERVAQRLQDIGPMGPLDATRAVFGALACHVDPGELDEVKQALPEEIRAFFVAQA